MKWNDPDSKLEMSFVLKIHNSLIEIECDVNRFGADDLVPVYMRAFDLARASVNLVAFALGSGMALILETMIDPLGTTTPLVFTDPRLAPLCRSFSINSSLPDPRFDQVCQFVLTEPPLFFALNDLIASITLPHESSVNCARAVERLRNLVASPDLPRKDAWAYFRKSLNISKEYLEFVTMYSTGPRHGNSTHIPGDITAELLRRAWIIMDRFLEFRKRGNAVLPVSEFPILAQDSV